jgi:hypothetical protein
MLLFNLFQCVFVFAVQLVSFVLLLILNVIQTLLAELAKVDADYVRVQLDKLQTNQINSYRKTKMEQQRKKHAY